MDLFPNLRILDLENKFKYKIITEFIYIIYSFDINKITKYQLYQNLNINLNNIVNIVKKKLNNLVEKLCIIIDIDNNAIKI